MATSSGEEYLAIIAKLMAEKDRLIAEKDELVASKDKLWREMHQMFQEQQIRYEAARPGQTFNTGHNTNALEVQQLREENSRLKRRNKDLEQALRDALETEGESEDDEMGQGGSSSKIEAKYASCSHLCYWLMLTRSGWRVPMTSNCSANLKIANRTTLSTCLARHLWTSRRTKEKRST